MAETIAISIVEVNRLEKGDILVTFSDNSVILYHAKFLYDVRNHDSNVEIVDPFKK